jgi:hypothetical protein
MSRYRYRVLETKSSTLILRDDGYRIAFKVLEPDATEAETWELWAEYKQCDLVGRGEEIADALMAP